MLTVSSRVDYGIQLLRQLDYGRAKNPQPLQRVAKDLRLPYRYLAQIARQLKRAGILESFEGVGGGYRLAQPARTITVGRVMVTLEPRRRLVRCLRDARGRCPNHSRCTVRAWWWELEGRFSRELERITIADLP